MEKGGFKIKIKESLGIIETDQGANFKVKTQVKI